MADGFASLAPSLEPAFFVGPAGEPVGDALAAGDGLAVAVGTGVAVGLGTSAFGSHAPRMAMLIARIADKIIDLLIVFLLPSWACLKRGFSTIRKQTFTAG